MIELLGVIAILGVLTVIAIASVSKYIGTSRSKSFVMMSQSAYQATENCILHNQLPDCHVGGTVLLKDDENKAQGEKKGLFDRGYMERLTNPAKSQPDCSGTVQIIDNTDSDTGISSYKYIVDLNCPGYRHSIIEWPNSKSLDELMGS